MLIESTRDVFTATTALSVIRVDLADWRGLFDFGFGVEDVDRGIETGWTLSEIGSVKVRGETAIPPGLYDCAWTYSPRFRRETIELLDVRGWGGIRVHAGNTARDTEGCQVPGLTRSVATLSVARSRAAVQWLEDRARAAWDRGEPVQWRIKRDPTAWAAYRGMV